MKRLVVILTSYIVIISSFAQGDAISSDVISKIRQEGLQNSKIMDIAFHLTDVSGPRLTNSPGYTRAATWAVNEMKKWGLVNAMQEPWGEFGKGWDLQKSYIAMTAPYYKPIIAFPKTWTKSTNGLQSADIILINAKDSAELEQYRGKLAGKVVMVFRTDSIRLSFSPDATRRTDEQLERMSNAKAPQPQQPADTAQQRRLREQRQRLRAPTLLVNKIKEMADKEGAIAILSMSPRGKDGTLFVQGGGSYASQAPENFLDIVIATEDYLSMSRLAKAGIPVKLEIDVKSTFYTADTKGYNVVAEIPGSDPKLKDEIVMLGGHLDSWQGSTGATDNAAGCAVMMEAVRIIKTLNLKPKRTIRIALWGGEEQGLHGSRNYVKNHFADPATMQMKPAHEKVTAYYNLDNGTGRIRGVYLQGNEQVVPVFTKWLEPFHDLGAKTVTISNTGGTDHLAFDAVGIPGFQFIQDEIEYDTRTHHTTMDSYDHLIAEDLKQAAVIVAAFVYQTAMRDSKLPRKELPKARGEAQRSF